MRVAQMSMLKTRTIAPAGAQVTNQRDQAGLVKVAEGLSQLQAAGAVAMVPTRKAARARRLAIHLRGGTQTRGGSRVAGPDSLRGAVPAQTALQPSGAVLLERCAPCLGGVSSVQRRTRLCGLALRLPGPPLESAARDAFLRLRGRSAFRKRRGSRPRFRNPPAGWLRGWGDSDESALWKAFPSRP